MKTTPRDRGLKIEPPAKAPRNALNWFSPWVMNGIAAPSRIDLMIATSVRSFASITGSMTSSSATGGGSTTPSTSEAGSFGRSATIVDPQ